MATRWRMPPGKLVRIGAQPLLGRGDAHFLERGDAAGAGGAAADAFVRAERVGHLRLDAQDRVQRHHRVLEDHRDPAAADAAHLLGRQAQEVHAAQPHLAPGDAPGRSKEPRDREAGDRLARSAFAHKRHDLALAHGQVDPVERADVPPADVEGGLQGRGCRARSPCVSPSECGFSTSRIRSPRTLTLTMRTRRTTPGSTLIHHRPLWR